MVAFGDSFTPHSADTCLLIQSQATAPVGAEAEMTLPFVVNVVESTTTLLWLRSPLGSGAVPEPRKQARSNSIAKTFEMASTTMASRLAESSNNSTDITASAANV